MTCAKRQVRAVLHLVDGQVFEGTNDCANPHSSCPRLPGDDYSLCRFACRQYGHAEIMALRKAREAHANVIGSTMTVYGSNRVAAACTIAMNNNQVKKVMFRELPFPRQHPGEPQIKITKGWR